jgi:hypothetical protein
LQGSVNVSKGCTTSGRVRKSSTIASPGVFTSVAQPMLSREGDVRLGRASRQRPGATPRMRGGAPSSEDEPNLQRVG